MGNKDEKIWVSQKALILMDDGKFLTIRRSKTAPSRPLFWDLPGGIFGSGEDAKDAILREIKEETGLEVKDLKMADVASGFNDINEFWATIFYTAKSEKRDIVLSYEHDDLKWVTADEFLQLESNSRLKKFVENFLKDHGR